MDNDLSSVQFMLHSLLVGAFRGVNIPFAILIIDPDIQSRELCSFCLQSAPYSMSSVGYIS